MTTKPSNLQKFGIFFFKTIGTSILRAWGHTLRIEGVENKPAERCIFVFWHDSLLFIPFFLRKTKAVTLVSRHYDGELIAIVLQKFGYRNIRGSDTEGGSQALKEMLENIKDGYSVLITPDGPKGPVNIIKKGIIYLSLKSGIPLVFVKIEYGKQLRMKTWDRLIVPFPFTKCKMKFLKPYFVNKEKTIEENLQEFSTYVC
ncbi:MAG: lysophospholipid acyltransferase family protein [Candidatus Coatesbacteria bacterium]|nr:lysophospholipid acyltransferase family protein [Candidatus Coatesbacteria bacterium]